MADRTTLLNALPGWDICPDCAHNMRLMERCGFPYAEPCGEHEDIFAAAQMRRTPGSPLRKQDPFLTRIDRMTVDQAIRFIVRQYKLAQTERRHNGLTQRDYTLRSEAGAAFRALLDRVPEHQSFDCAAAWRVEIREELERAGAANHNVLPGRISPKIAS